MKGWKATSYTLAYTQHWHENTWKQKTRHSRTLSQLTLMHFLPCCCCGGCCCFSIYFLCFAYKLNSMNISIGNPFVVIRLCSLTIIAMAETLIQHIDTKNLTHVYILTSIPTYVYGDVDSLYHTHSGATRVFISLT